MTPYGETSARPGNEAQPGFNGRELSARVIALAPIWPGVGADHAAAGARSPDQSRCARLGPKSVLPLLVTLILAELDCLAILHSPDVHFRKRCGDSVSLRVD